MIKLCTNCKRQTEFKETHEHGKYMCEACKKIMHNCKSKDCNYMISLGPYCKKCDSGKIKKYGLPVLFTMAAAATIAFISNLFESKSGKED